MSSSGVDTPEDDIRSKTFVYVLTFKSKHKYIVNFTGV